MSINFINNMAGIGTDRIGKTTHSHGREDNDGESRSRSRDHAKKQVTSPSRQTTVSDPLESAQPVENQQPVENKEPAETQSAEDKPAFEPPPKHPSTVEPAHTHDHDHDHGGAHGHTHEHYDHAGTYAARDLPDFSSRNFAERGFTIGIGGPVGSGKTALTLALCQRLRGEYNLGKPAVTNDIFTREDQEFLIAHKALPAERIQAIETGGCPHAAIREDISANAGALEALQARYGCQILLVESGGDNLAANYSRELADYIIYVIDVAGGDKIPRKGGPGITHSDLLVINKTDLAPHVGASLEVMDRDARRMRGDGPTLFTSVRKDEGVDGVVDLVLAAWKGAGMPGTAGAVGNDEE